MLSWTDNKKTKNRHESGYSRVYMTFRVANFSMVAKQQRAGRTARVRQADLYLCCSHKQYLADN